MKLGELDIEEAAKKAAGNWQDFKCFVWFRDREVEDADQWAVIYTHHRDSGLARPKQRSLHRKRHSTPLPRVMILISFLRAIVIGPLATSTVSACESSRTERSPTPSKNTTNLPNAWTIIRFWTKAITREREYEATLENIEDAAWRLKNEFDLPEGWEGEVYSWLSDNESSEIENTDDQGGYPSEEALRRAFDSLGYSPAA